MLDVLLLSQLKDFSSAVDIENWNQLYMGCIINGLHRVETWKKNVTEHSSKVLYSVHK